MNISFLPLNKNIYTAYFRAPCFWDMKTVSHQYNDHEEATIIIMFPSYCNRMSWHCLLLAEIWESFLSPHVYSMCLLGSQIFRTQNNFSRIILMILICYISAMALKIILTREEIRQDEWDHQIKWHDEFVLIIGNFMFYCENK